MDAHAFQCLDHGRMVDEQVLQLVSSDTNLLAAPFIGKQAGIVKLLVAGVDLQ